MLRVTRRTGAPAVNNTQETSRIMLNMSNMRANLPTAFPALSDASRLVTSSKSELATILSRRQGLNIGWWNLCSIKCSLTQAFVAEEFYLYNLDILCVSETRLNGQTTLDLIAPSGKKAILFNWPNGRIRPRRSGNNHDTQDRIGNP